jgi:hypothetical protein
MSGKEIKNKYPGFYLRNKLKDSDFVYLCGEKIKILRKI